MREIDFTSLLSIKAITNSIIYLMFYSLLLVTLNLGLEILLSEENGWVDLQQGVGRLINAIVAVLGPELAPGSIFFSRCKSVIAEISSSQETATLLESVRFTQQLVLFAPQAVSVHSHVLTLLPTLSSRQPALRHLAISTLRHLIEKDPVSVVTEQIEDNLFLMLDEETDTDIGNSVRSTIMRLLHASSPMRPSHWISICKRMVLAVSTRNTETTNNDVLDGANSSSGHTHSALGEDDENMVSSAEVMSTIKHEGDVRLRYRTRVFAAECLSQLPVAVGKNPAHFDLSLAREQSGKGQTSSDWLILQLQELISVAYQISKIQLENMQPIGVELLCTIIDKFETAEDPELPGRILLEQYQAQLVSTLRTALEASSGPILLEAGLQLATKTLTSGVIRGDQVAVKRIFSLISRPLDDFKELFYPSFAEWVSSKIKIRLLAAHASLKCYTYAFLRRNHTDAHVPDEFLALPPLFSKYSVILGRHWIMILKDYFSICFNIHLGKNWKPFLDGIDSPLISSKLRPCLEQAWPVIFPALVLDASPVKVNTYSESTQENTFKDDFISGYCMVKLDSDEFKFLWGLAFLILFQGNASSGDKRIFPLSVKVRSGESSVEEARASDLKPHEVALTVLQFLCTERFFNAGFVTVDACRELLQVFTYVGFDGDSWKSGAIAVLSQVVQNCPEGYLNVESVASLITELCLAYLFHLFLSSSQGLKREDLTSRILSITRTLVNRLEPKIQLKSLLPFTLAGYKSVRGSTEWSLSKIIEFVQSTMTALKALIQDKYVRDDYMALQAQKIIGACQNAVDNLMRDCIEGIHILKSENHSSRRLLLTKLAFCLEQTLGFSDLVYNIELVQESTSSNSINMAVFTNCINSMKAVLSDENIEVQAIGAQVLKSTLQKKASIKSESFVVVLTGELFEDSLIVIQSMLKEPVSRESAALAAEWLKTLVLMQSLPNGTDCQKGLMSLLLEAILMVLSGTEDAISQEARELRSSTVRLVSSLAQIPSAAMNLKEVMLGMPAADRQKIQETLRTFVTQRNTTPVKPTTLTLEIKLPLQSKAHRVENPSSPVQHDEIHGDEQVDEDEDEDEDWDSFQSFPASAVAAPLHSTDGVHLEQLPIFIHQPNLELHLRPDEVHDNYCSRPSINSTQIALEDHDMDKDEEIGESRIDRQNYSAAVENPDNNGTLAGKVLHGPVPGEDHDSPSADSPQFSEDAQEPVEVILEADENYDKCSTVTGEDMDGLVPRGDHDSPLSDSPQSTEDAKEPVEVFLGTNTEPNKEPVDVFEEHQSSFHPSDIEADGSASTQEPLESSGDTVLEPLALSDEPQLHQETGQGSASSKAGEGNSEEGENLKANDGAKREVSPNDDNGKNANHEETLASSQLTVELESSTPHHLNSDLLLSSDNRECGAGVEHHLEYSES
ncbi:SWEETIE-like protein [Drosera capensis]